MPVESFQRVLQFLVAVAVAGLVLFILHASGRPEMDVLEWLGIRM